MIHGTLLVEEPDTASDDVTAGRPTAEEEPALHEVRQADFALQGMSCASCVGRIESAIGAVPGVDDVSANFDRKSVVEGKRVSVRVDLGGAGIIKKKKAIR